MRRFWHGLRSGGGGATVGAALLALFFLVAAFAPFLAPYDPLSVGVTMPLSEPTTAHPMGADDLGRDVLSTVLMGTRTTLAVGLFAALVATVLGTIIGLGAGYAGGTVDKLLNRVIEIFLVMPLFFLALLVVSIFGNSIANVIVVIGIVSWPTTARIVRGEVLVLRQLEFVQAAKSLGAGEARIAFRHVLPNVVSLIIVAGSLEVPRAILLEAGLSFLGMGDPNVASWGLMLSIARVHLRQAWWLAVFPGGAISLSVLSFNLVGDGITAAMDPRLRTQGAARGK